MTKQAYWKERIEQWERSGLSQRKFCEERKLAVSTFQWWRSKLRRGESESSAPSFLPLALSASTASIEVELRSKTRLRLEGEAALRALDRLIARIR